MPKYCVGGWTKVYITIDVEVENEDDAIDKAAESCPGLSSYASNGAMSGRLIGHNVKGMYIEPSEEIEWEDAELIEE